MKAHSNCARSGLQLRFLFYREDHHDARSQQTRYTSPQHGGRYEIRSNHPQPSHCLSRLLIMRSISLFILFFRFSLAIYDTFPFQHLRVPRNRDRARFASRSRNFETMPLYTRRRLYSFVATKGNKKPMQTGRL